jgi:hypothetical protein
MDAPFAALLVLWPEVNAPHLTDCGTPAWVAGGTVETYPAGLAVVYLEKLSLPQNCLSSHGRSGVTVPKTIVKGRGLVCA